MNSPKRSDGNGIVYSTGVGRMCPRCSRPVDRCSCRQDTIAAPGDGIVRIGRETKGRKGKGVTVVTGISLPAAELEALATRLKKRCGSGGTVRAGVIEIQGDHRDLLVAELDRLGFKVKRSGG